MRIVIKGAGDIASGIALRLRHCGFDIIMTELAFPTSIRRTVCFSEAVFHGKATVEDEQALLCTPNNVESALNEGKIAVLVDPNCNCVDTLKPDVLVDARLMKRNVDTKITDAPFVVGVGPGYTAGKDCHAVVETQRGHRLGRVIWKGSAEANTGIPGSIAGFSVERLLRAPCNGIFTPVKCIGDEVNKGDVAATVNGVPMICLIGGTLRGLLPDGTEVFEGMKSGDVDPRCQREHCFTASDKALAVAGGVLEAILCQNQK